MTTTTDTIIANLPDAKTIREKLAENYREANTLRKLLRVAESVKPNEDDKGQGE